MKGWIRFMKKNLDQMNTDEFNTFLQRLPFSIWDVDPEWDHELKGYQEVGNKFCSKCGRNHFLAIHEKKIEITAWLRKLKGLMEEIK